MPSTLPRFTNTIHIRDFVVDVGPDRTRPGVPNSIEIHADINVFPEDNFYDSTVTVEPIHTSIRVYLTPSNRELYIPNAFFYAAGPFSTTMMTDNKLKITVRPLSIERCDCFATQYSQNDLSSNAFSSDILVMFPMLMSMKATYRNSGVL